MEANRRLADKQENNRQKEIRSVYDIWSTLEVSRMLADKQEGNRQKKKLGRLTKFRVWWRQAKQAGKNIINVKNKKPAKSWPTSQKGPKS